MLVSLVGTAAAAPLSSGTITLVSVEYVPQKGPIFTFHVTGHFSKADLKGFVHVEGGEDFTVSCTPVDDETVKCGTSKAAAGKNVSITWGGSTFWATVPVAPEFCYGVWDFWTFEEFQNGWRNFGPHCQDSPAKEGDELWYTVPAGSYPWWDESFEAPVWFINDPRLCEYVPVPDHGEAYYFAPWCVSTPF
jgi:hypothetical protein